MNDINYFATASIRGKTVKFGIKTDDRRRHIYVVGKTGMGKTEMLKNMAIQDIQNGQGIGFLDPHGEAAEDLLNYIPESRIKDVIYFNPADLDYPIAFNIMEKVDFEYRHLVASGLMGVFKKIWPDVWSARMEYILNNAILALLEIPGTTLLSINRLLSDPEFREKTVQQLKDPVVKAFWVKEFSRYTQRYEVEATAAIENKVGQFISSPIIRNIVGQPESTINIRQIMDEKKIFIMNLSKGKVGEDYSKLLGALLITKLQLAAMSRVDIPEEQRSDFFLYVDEFQNFATESFVNVLSEARKYRLALILAHQYIAQMEEKVRDAVFGNVGTMIAFRIGAEDAEFLEKEFAPELSVEDLVNLPKYHIYLKLMINGVTSRPFLAQTLPPFPKSEKSFKKEIIEFSRKMYGVEKSKVEQVISDMVGLTDLSPENNGNSNQNQQKVYEARCQICNKKTYVPFKPDGKRPIFCESCLKRVKQERLEAQLKAQKKSFEELPGISLEEIKTIEPVFFSDKDRQKEIDEQKINEQDEQKKKRKEPKLEELKDILKDIKDKDKKEEKKDEGEIKPGQSVEFD